MAVSEECKKEILRTIERHLPRGPFRRKAKIKLGKRLIGMAIRKVKQKDYSMNIVDYINQKYPKYSKRLSEAPACIQQYTVGELIETYYELRDKI